MNIIINPGLKKLLAKLLLLTLCCVLLDLMFGFAFRYLFKTQNDGKFYNITYNIDKCNEEMIMLGSSRVQANYNPAIFYQELGITCRNTGQGGQGLIYFMLQEKEILNRYKPKVFILNIDPNALEGPLEYGILSILRPYVRNHPDIEKELIANSIYEKYKLYSSIYQYNSMMLYLLMHAEMFNKEISIDSNNGWLPRIGNDAAIAIPKKVDVKKEEKKVEINKEKVKYLEKIINDISSQHIPLLLCLSPNYLPMTTKTETVKYLQKMKLKHQVYLLDYTTDTSFVNKKELFFNSNHMNQEGANIFTQKVCEWMKNNMKV